ncbi:MAG TPA: protein translocase subunit SecF [Candidatus Acidoferrales bacterium]|nr:protein translocase subunit SecF [Candidatus Acidoferrales bacterium]
MFFRRLNWNVVGWFRIVSTISYAVIGLGIAMMAYNWTTHHYFIKLGLSFTGGTDVTVKFTRPVTVAQIRSSLVTIGVTDETIDSIAKAGDDQPGERYTISTQVAFGDNPAKLWSALSTAAPVDRTQSEIDSVGPSLSREYLTRALEALVIAISIQFLYIAFRFGWNYIFGTVVVIALVRDALMMVGIYAIAGKRADDAFLAALLTVIGYSVMDTIVILDRIRENVKIMAGQPYDRIVNTSILQTMTRSINTLATVVVTLVALLAFGGASLQNFAFALLVGVCSGGYHSIFYSAPLVHVLRQRQLKRASAHRSMQLTSISGEKPRTVAQARAQAKTEAERLAILEARKQRRAREKAERGGRPAQPARYKKRRPEPTVVEPRDFQEHEFEMDPLDAQNAGFHDDELALGHEEIHLNLEETHAEETPHVTAGAPENPD